MERVGAWLIGARGSISAVTIAGQSAICRGSAETTGMVTERPEFKQAGLLDLSQIVFGGHDITEFPLRSVASRVFHSCGIPELKTEVLDDLDACELRIRPGMPPKGDPGTTKFPTVTSDLEAAEILSHDLYCFRRDNRLDHVVVINLASTEPLAVSLGYRDSVISLQAEMRKSDSQVPASTIYAYAAISAGCGYLNFTPSLGSDIPALWELARANRVVHMGSDGRTGETLVKSVLAQMFRERNLEVLSWFGQNILGGGDGRSLSNPLNKASKLATKGGILSKILGYAPEHHVGIDYVEALEEWKIAWDHIQFSGFLGGRMDMQFTWRGIDSLLAAPLILDLVRLSVLAMDRGEYGVLTPLASFFKRPLGTVESSFFAQNTDLLNWVYGRVSG